MEGQLTRLLLDFDSGKALVETPPGSRNFNFKPRVKATLLLEGSAPPTGGESATLSRTTDKTSGLLLSPAYQGEEEGGGTLEIVLGDTTTSEAATPDVQGKVVVQGMDATNNTGTDVAVFLGEAQAGSTFITSSEGPFAFNLATGSYQLRASHPGWLSLTVDFTLDGSGPVDLGTVTLPAGDADLDGDVDFEDLRLFQRSLGQPQPDPLTDPNADGVSDIFDLARRPPTCSSLLVRTSLRASEAR